MTVFVVGLSHKTAPLALREKFAVDEHDLPDVLGQLHQLPAASGVVATATCNRFEVYGSSESPDETIAAVKLWLRRRVPENGVDLDNAVYTFAGPAAVRHIFRVSASLDSMVVGEAQILGQLKKAFSDASAAGTVDSQLSRCLNYALRVAKQVRSETGIGRQAVSVPQVAVQLARKIFGDLAGRSVLLVGAGKIAEVAARNLGSEGLGRVLVANRSKERAVALAKAFDGTAHLLDELGELLAEADIVITSTSARDYVIRVADVKEIIKSRRYRPLFLVDLAVPRDIDPRIGNLHNCYVFDIDDLQQVVDSNLDLRKREARQAERLVATGAEQYLRKQAAAGVTPVIVSLRKRLTAIKEEELERALKSLHSLDDRDRKHVEKLATTLVNRILHDPTVAIKRMAEQGAGKQVAGLVQTLFDLDDETESND